MKDIVVASAARTPVGSFNGAFATLPAHELGAVAIRGALERAGVAPDEVQEVIMGQILTAVLDYSDANSASAYNESFNFEGVSAGNGYINCPVFRQETMSLTKLADNKLLGELVESKRNADPDNLACEASIGSGKSQKFMFYMTK